MTLSPYRDFSPQIDTGAWVHPSAQVIGDVTLGAHSSIWCHAVLRGDVNAIRVGEGSNIQDLSICHVSHKTASKPLGSPLSIGNFVTVGHGVILHGCDIGDECLIGMGSLVMDDVVIEDHVMLGAGSLVSPGKRLSRGMLYMGRPAIPVRPLTEAEMAYFKYSAEHYIRIKNDYLGNLCAASSLEQGS
ncbi:MAG: gamma carbonic anhydrase family protein [Burkholderiales bacterium]|jgi:carbonic anhydrase/acetyltransferase-like protein (isoleucine patch superfamily)